MSYDRDRSNEEKIINRLECLNDKMQEVIDVLEMILENQNEQYMRVIDICNRIGCNHHIDYHKLFGGCQVSECECEQFNRKEN